MAIWVSSQYRTLDESRLRQLGDSVPLSAESCLDLAAWCIDRAENSGDARYCSIARTLIFIAEEWDHRGALPTSVVTDLADLLQRGLRDALDAAEPADGSYFGRLLREQVVELFRSN